MAIMVQISELTLRDEDRGTIFTDLNFRLARGEWASIVSPDGAGKTTLFRLICGEIRPDRGQILVDDRNIIRINPDRLRTLRRRIGVVPRRPPLLRRQTLRGGLIFLRRALGASRSDAEMKAHEVLALVELQDLADRSVDELDEPERQRFHLALVLSHDPVLLLLDDPLTALDPPQQRRYLQLLERIHLRRRLSLLLATSDVEAIRDAPATVYCLQDGQLQRIVDKSASPSTADVGETDE